MSPESNSMKRHLRICIGAGLIGLLLTAPVLAQSVSSLTIATSSSSRLWANQTTEYSVTIVGYHPSGNSYIDDLRVMFYDDTFNTAYGRGYLAWGQADSDITYYGGTWVLKGNATGGGRWGWYNSGWGNDTYIETVGCETSTTSTTRTVKFTFHVKSAYAGDLNQDLGGFMAYSNHTGNTGWQYYTNRFNVPSSYFKLDSLAISSSSPKPDFQTTYTATLKATHPDGTGSIRDMRVLFGSWNYPRGYVGWGLNDTELERYGDTWETANATGGGRWGWVSDNWGRDDWITPISCSTSTSGNQRTAVFTFKVNDIYIGKENQRMQGWAADLTTYPYGTNWKDFGVKYSVGGPYIYRSGEISSGWVGGDYGGPGTDLNGGPDNGTYGYPSLASDGADSQKWSLTSGGTTAYAIAAHPAWLANNNWSKWLSPSTTYNIGSGNFTFRTSFNMTGYDTNAASIQGKLAVDNSIVSIKLNGTTISGALDGTPGFGYWTGFEIPLGSNFSSGTNYLDITINNSAAGPGGLRIEAQVQAPFRGTAPEITSTIQYEDYDIGQYLVAYSDALAPGNISSPDGHNIYRATHVDIANSGQSTPTISYMGNGDWMEYTVNVTNAGRYDFSSRHACGTLTGGRYDIYVDDVLVGDDVVVPFTGNYDQDWSVWTEVYVHDMYMSAGKHIVRIEVKADNTANSDWFRWTCRTPLEATNDQSYATSTSAIMWKWTKTDRDDYKYAAYDASSGGNFKWRTGYDTETRSESSFSTNTLYHRYLETENDCGNESTSRLHLDRYTLNQNPTAPTFSNVQTNQMTVTTTGPVNLTAGSSGLLFCRNGTDVSSTSLSSTHSSLSANTKYAYGLRARNGDAIPTGNYATRYGPTLGVSGKFSGNTCAQFDGSNDYFLAPEGFKDFTSGITVEFWCYRTGSNDAQRIIDFGNGAGVDNIIAYGGGSGDHTTMYFGTWTSGGTATLASAANAFRLNTWDHFVCTIATNGTAKIYRNGTDITTSGSGMNLPSNVTRTTNRIGTDIWSPAPGSSPWQGKIDELAIYDTTLSATRVAAHAAATTSSDFAREVLVDDPVAYWRFDESSGAAYAEDTNASGSGVKWTLQNTPTGPTYSDVLRDRMTVTTTDPVNITLEQSGVIFNKDSVDQSKVQTLSQTYTGFGTNTEHTFKAKGVNGENVQTGYGSTTSKYTMQNVATKPTFSNVDTDSFTVSTTGPVNLTSDSSGVKYARVVDGDEDTNQSLSYNATGLTPNVGYYYSVGGLNGDAEVAQSYATYQGPTMQQSSAISGSYALSFDGSNDYVDLPSGWADFTDGFSIECWVYPTSDGSTWSWQRYFDATIMSGGNRTHQLLFCRAGTANDVVLIIDNDAAGSSEAYVNTTTGVLTFNTWHHFVASVHKDGNVYIYHNGTQVASGTASGMPSVVNRIDTVIGKDHTGGSYLEGKFDELAVYKHPLSQSEAQAHYNARTSEAGYVAAVEADYPVVWYRFEETTGSTYCWDSAPVNNTSLKYTLAAAPSIGNNVTCDKPVNTPQPENTTFTFSNPASFGEGTHAGNAYKATKFKYVWDTNATYSFTGSESDWSTGTIQFTPTGGAEQDYYLHVQSWNEEDVATPTVLHYGPFKYDGKFPAVTITKRLNPLQSDPASDVPIIYDAVFDEPVDNFELGTFSPGGTRDVQFTGSGEVLEYTVSGSSTDYVIQITDLRLDDGVESGNFVATIPEAAAEDYAGNANSESTIYSPGGDNDVLFSAPMVTITGWQSIVTHGNGVGDRAITLNASAGSGTAYSEPRRIGFGTTHHRIVINFDKEVTARDGSLGPNDVKITSGQTTYNADALNMSNGDTTMEILCDPNDLPEDRVYTFSFVDGSAKKLEEKGVPHRAVNGDSDCIVRFMIGDVFGGAPGVVGDGIVNLSDLGAIKTLNRNENMDDIKSGANLPHYVYDVNADGRINLIDVALSRNNLSD